MISSRLLEIFTDGMVTLARYFELEIIHAHTNAAPSIEDEDWYSDDCADSMLIARKKYNGKTRTIDLNNYRCIPTNHEIIDGLKTYREFKRLSEPVIEEIDIQDTNEKIF